MRTLITILLLLLAFWLGKQLLVMYQDVQKRHTWTYNEENAASQSASSTTSSATLPGLPPNLEASLSAAEKQGAPGLRTWLNQYRSFAQDPRLAAIELDYVVLIIHQDPGEARRIFNEVRSRTPTFSPIYDRVKRLEKTFQ